MLSLFVPSLSGNVGRMTLRPKDDSSDTVFRFVETRCAAWGTPSELGKKASGALNNLRETARHFAPGQTLELELAGDKGSLDVPVGWTGKPFEFPKECPPLDGGKEDVIGLSAYLVRQSAAKTDFRTEGDRVFLWLHFEI